MLLGTLGASLLGNLLTGKGTVTAGEGTIRTGYGIIRAGEGMKKSSNSREFFATSSNKFWNKRVLWKWT